MGALKKLEDGIGEIKRMYIRPEHRGQGYGKTILNRLIDKSRELGYSTIRLDTADFMTTAQSMYRSAGFTMRDKYSGSEIPEWYQPYTVFMEKKL
ncbi:MAG: GNAT family N-acetyltransferase [Candidatus Bathyarchaeota archaeon]|nr:MAG: GNAT family N-acetyltransferase [Candidatus Bathyarchaeota archaeon]